MEKRNQYSEHYTTWLLLLKERNVEISMTPDVNVPLKANNAFTPFAGIFVTNVLQIEMLVDVIKHQ